MVGMARNSVLTEKRDVLYFKHTRTSKIAKSGCAVPMRSPSGRIAGMSPERFAELRAIGQDSRIDCAVILETIDRETSRYVEMLGREIREGKGVYEASRFLRWLHFSGILSLLENYCLPGQDFSPLLKKVGELTSECGERLKGGRESVKYAESDIAEINRKLDVLMASSARPVNVVALPECVEITCRG